MEALVTLVELILLRGQYHMSFVCTCGCAKSFKESVIAKEQMSRCEHPRFREHDRVFHRGFVNQHVAVAGVTFHHMLLIAMEQRGLLDNLVILGFTECSRFGVSLRAA